MNQLTVTEVLRLGLEAVNAQKFSLADKYYTSILKVFPNHPEANYQLGMLALKVDQPNEALIFLQKALLAEKQNTIYWESFLKILFDARRYEEIREWLELAKKQPKSFSWIPTYETKIAQHITSNNSNGLPTEKLKEIMNLYHSGDLESSLFHATRVLKDFPSAYKLHNLCASVCAQLKRYDEAKGHCHQALKFNPHYFEAYNNLASIYLEKGDFKSALKYYQKSIQISPENAKPHYNIGIIFNKQGLNDDAIASFKQALKLDPNYSWAHNNLGISYLEKGDYEDAILAFVNALKCDPNLDTAYYNFGGALQNNVFTGINIDDVILRLLEKESYVRPVDIVHSAIETLKLNLDFSNLINCNKFEEQKISLTAMIRSVFEFPLLLKLLKVCPLPDLEIEYFLTLMRKELLKSLPNLDCNSDLLQFQTALAMQCYLNEFSFFQSSEEKKLIDNLAMEINSLLSKGKQPKVHYLLMYSCYRPLRDLRLASLLVQSSSNKDVFVQQLYEPEEEERIKNQLISIDGEVDKTSALVRTQYEANPYPRWVKLRLRLDPASIQDVVTETQLTLNNYSIFDIDKPSILVAGCGTGQHSIETASRFKNCKVLAIDLSTASLAYAKRKTDELGLRNIEYMHGNILHLENLNREFDIIESCGVLHHMENPFLGWSVLNNCLKPGGLMKIALYSELARSHIVKIREKYNEIIAEVDADRLRDFRRELSLNTDETFSNILRSPDFYTLSTLRDLLFHVQEHRFTLPQIKSFLERLSLSFCGFENKPALHRFNDYPTDDWDPLDLDHWHHFELENPRTFSRMYEFWCQK